jgi:membrane-bound inhibitor of C-type lysozyme
MLRNISFLLLAALTLAGCGSWSPWGGGSGGSSGPYTPPGATAYACEGNKRLFVRFEGDGKSAWVIYPDRQFRLDRIASSSGNQYSNGRTLLMVSDGETALSESGNIEFGKCKQEGK